MPWAEKSVPMSTSNWGAQWSSNWRHRQQLPTLTSTRWTHLCRSSLKTSSTWQMARSWKISLAALLVGKTNYTPGHKIEQAIHLFQAASTAYGNRAPSSFSMFCTAKASSFKWWPTYRATSLRMSLWPMLPRSSVVILLECRDIQPVPRRANYLLFLRRWSFFPLVFMPYLTTTAWKTRYCNWHLHISLPH